MAMAEEVEVVLVRVRPVPEIGRVAQRVVARVFDERPAGAPDDAPLALAVARVPAALVVHARRDERAVERRHVLAVERAYRAEQVARVGLAVGPRVERGAVVEARDRERVRTEGLAERVGEPQARRRCGGGGTFFSPAANYEHGITHRAGM